MRFKNISLPYPVLGVNDDILPRLSEDCISVSEKITPMEYIFLVSLKHQNDDISRLISDGSAEYACEVTCNSTYLRKCFHSPVPEIEIHLPKNVVNGRINFNCFISAKTDIAHYVNGGFHPDYSGFSFDLERGDLLAVFPQAFVNTNIKFDKLFAAGSFMQIVESNDNNSTWFNLKQDKIRIEMPHDLFEKYQNIGNAFPEVIHSSIVHNALVYALCNLDDYSDSGKLWSDSLLQRLQMSEFASYDVSDFKNDIQLVFRIADSFLKDPYNRLLDSLERINSNTNNNWEE